MLPTEETVAKEQEAASEDGEDARSGSPGRLVAERSSPDAAPRRAITGAHTVFVTPELPTDVQAALQRVPGLDRAGDGHVDLVVASALLPPPTSLRLDRPALLVVGDPTTADLGWLEYEVDHWCTAVALVAAPDIAVRQALAAHVALRTGPAGGRSDWIHAIATMTGASAVARITPDQVEWWPGPVAGLPTDPIAAYARSGALVLPTPESVANRLGLVEAPVAALVAVPLGARVADGVLIAVGGACGVDWARATVPLLRAAAAVATRETLVRRALAAEAGRRWIEKVLHRLLSVVSHDLRNPLFAVQLGVKILERQHGKTEQIETIQNTIATATQLLRRLVDAGRQVLEVPSVPGPGFGADLAELWSRVSAGARRRHPNSAIVGAPEPQHVMVDPVVLERVLTAVVDNALQHGTSADPVAVSTRIE